jgi:hypothetical protein
MTPAEIIAGLEKKNRALTAKNDEYIELVEIRALAERNLSLAITQYTLEYKLEKHPVTLIDKLVAGDTAKLKMDYEVAKGVEKSCLQSISILKSQIDTYRSLLSWLKAEMQSQ